ncbi:MAG: glycerol kinase GlpK [Phycisphaerae bacterium]|nr:glycerol kinase GlpK [Phycisphaerae bacterium]
MADVILSIDQGTTGSTALLTDSAGRILSRKTVEFPQHYPQPGWVEHDLHEIWTSVRQAVEAVLAACDGVGVADIRAIGITNQRETVALWSRDDLEPLGNAIVWQCRRTAPQCHELRADGLETQFTRRTGLLLDPYFSGTKLNWLLDHRPGARDRAGDGHLAAGTIDTYLIARLTGGAAHVTDVTNASRTLLMSLKDRTWDDWCLEALDVPRLILPEIRPSAGLFGHTAGLGWLPDGIPIGGVAGDQQAALFGDCCVATGQAKCTYGTGAFLLLNAGDAPVSSSSRLLSTMAWETSEVTTYALEGSVFIAGAAVQWLRDGLKFIERAPEVEALAAQVPDSGGVVFVPAFVGLGAPYWNPDARGTIVGLTRGTTRAHIARATLEGIAFQVAEVVEAMAKDVSHPIEIIRADGGAAANDLLMQMQADLLGVPVERGPVLETTGVGAALLAALGVGLHQSIKEVAATWQTDRVFEPVISRDEAADRIEEWRRAVARAS